MPNELEIEYSNSVKDNVYRLERKVKNSDGAIVTEPIQLSVDWANIDQKPLVFGSFIEFPTIGSINTLYVAKDRNKIYV